MKIVVLTFLLFAVFFLGIISPSDGSMVTSLQKEETDSSKVKLASSSWQANEEQDNDVGGDMMRFLRGGGATPPRARGLFTEPPTLESLVKNTKNLAQDARGKMFALMGEGNALHVKDSQKQEYQDLLKKIEKAATRTTQKMEEKLDAINALDETSTSDNGNLEKFKDSVQDLVQALKIACGDLEKAEKAYSAGVDGKIVKAGLVDTVDVIDAKIQKVLDSNV